MNTTDASTPDYSTPATSTASETTAARQTGVPELSTPVAGVPVIRLNAKASPAVATVLQGKVIGVSEGDTITLLVGKKQIVVRLYGIDCPERDQPFGERALQLTTGLAAGKVATVYTRGTNSAGHTLGRLFVGETCVNDALLLDGLAWWTEGSTRADRVGVALEQQAREARVGLWSVEAARKAEPIAPWEWRRGARPVTKEPASGPDLIVSRVRFEPARPRVGELIQPYISFKNIGDQPAGKFSFQIAPNGVGTAGYNSFLDETAPGQERQWLAGGMRPKKAGTFTIHVIVDPNSNVVESNEANNIVAVTLVVDP